MLTANNRLVAPGDTTGDDTGSDQMRYDKAGNLVYDNYSAASGQRGTMTYDAENRMLTAVNGNHQYRYDADGKRTRRAVQSQPEMWMVYGVGGELVAEYDAGLPGGTLKKEYGYRGGQILVVYDSTLSGNDQLKWMVTDHLGSTRMLVNRSGDLSGIQRRDYLPFGEELALTIGHRNASGAGYVGGNNPRQKFTGKERDGETGLDYFLARQCSSLQGRFTGVDKAGPIPINPQTLNKYAYANNNPLRFVDQDGNFALPALLVSGAAGFVGGAIISGGLELARQVVFEGKSLTGDVNGVNWTKVGAKALNGGIYGAAVGLTGGMAVPTAVAFLGGAGAVGGMVERAVDGDPNTSPTYGPEVLLDTIAGSIGGAVGIGVGKVTSRHFYQQRMAAMDAYEAVIGTPLEIPTIRKYVADHAYKLYSFPFYRKPDSFGRPALGTVEHFINGAARGGTRAGITLTGHLALRNYLETQSSRNSLLLWNCGLCTK